MYTNNAYLNHSTMDRKDKSKPLIVTMCGTYKLIIPELSEPPVRTLGATIPENESHIFR